jgi:hypothetical protein
MIEFESFCFLQNHKTGCTLVETFLRAHCSEDIVRYEKHWAPPARRPGKFHFVGVREPLDTYLSLFNYGLDGRGEVFLHLGAAGRGALYAAGIDGFAAWLRQMLDPSWSAALYPAGCAWMAPEFGLLSARFLRLAIPGSQRGPGGNWAERLAGPGAVDAVLRYETLVPQLHDLVQGPLRHAFVDLDAALAWLAAPPRVNASQRRDRSGLPSVPAELRARLAERERVLYDAFYPGQRPDRGPGL